MPVHHQTEHKKQLGDCGHHLMCLNRQSTRLLIGKTQVPPWHQSITNLRGNHSRKHKRSMRLTKEIRIRLNL